MEKNKSVDAMTRIIQILEPLPSEERARVVRAALVLLGESKVVEPVVSDVAAQGIDTESFPALPPRARVWMKQNAVTLEELQQVFHMSDDVMEVIAAHIPGKNKKEQTYNAYILTGIVELLATGNPSFQDKSARALCERSGCYDSANHSAHLRDKGNKFTGTKDRGWILTAPGLKRGAEIIKELNKTE